MLFDPQPKWLAILRSIPLYIMMPIMAAHSYLIGMIIAPFFSGPMRFKIIMGSFCHSITWICKTICGVNYHIQGLDRIPKDNRGYVIMSKHQSTWETFALQNVFDPNTVVLKKELLYIPFFGWALYLLNPIFINRKEGKSALKQILEKGTERLHQGEDILIFPEGTRVEPGQRKPFSKGGALLATTAGVDVIPVAHNAGEHWNNKRWLKIPGTIQVVIGDPISTKGKTWEEVNQEVELWVNKTVDEISAIPYQEDMGTFEMGTTATSAGLVAQAIRAGQDKWNNFLR